MDKQNDDIFLRFGGNRNSAIVVFLGEPHVIEQHTTIDSNRPPPLSIAINVAYSDTLVVRVLECNVTVFKDILHVREKYGLDKWSYEIVRHENGATSILPEGQLSPERRLEIAKLVLHDLPSLYGQSYEGACPPAP